MSLFSVYEVYIYTIKSINKSNMKKSFDLQTI